MKDSNYSRFESDNLNLRDELAIDRTFLANERTLLAYLRSGVALFIAGTSIIHFTSARWFQVIGITCIPVGIIAITIGIFRYRKVNKAISIVRKQSELEKNKNVENAE